MVLVVQNSVTNAAYDLQATSTAIQRQVPTSKLLQLLSDLLLHQQLPSYQSLRHEISSKKLEDLPEVPKNLEWISDEQVYTWDVMRVQYVVRHVR